MTKNKSCLFKKGQAVLVIAFLELICQPASGSGFQVNEQNAVNLGTAYAGTASLAEDASTGFYNSAGLVRLSEEQIALSGVWINGNSRVKANSATATFLSPLTRQPIQIGPGSSKQETQALLPAVHYFKRINHSWVFGLNIVTPFGLKTKYEDNSIVRYMASRSELRTHDIAPSLAYDFGNGFSLGVGADIMYLVARLDTRINNPGSLIPSPSTDGLLENRGNAWGFGFHTGALWEVSGCTRFGLNYRSLVKEHIKGNSVSFIPGILPEQSQGVRSRVTLPEVAVISAYHAFNEQWAALLDAEWTHWKQFKTLELRLDNGNKIITQEQFKDSYRFALGASFQPDETWKFRIGTAWDKAPTHISTRTLRIPDQNRTWAALGTQYRVNKCFAVDFGYAHLFFKKAKINEVAPTAIGGTQGFQSFVGDSKMRADLIGIQLTWDIV